MIKFRCEHCAQKIGVPDDRAGHHIKCPRCKHRLLVQAAAPAGNAPVSAPAAPLSTKKTAPAVTQETPEPARITRGQTLDLEDKPPEAPPQDVPDETADDAPASSHESQASLLSLAGIGPDTVIGKTAAGQPPGSAAPGSEATRAPLVDKVPNWPGIAAAFAPFGAGVLISVGAPTLLTLAVAGAGAVAGLSGLIVALAAKRWEYWSALVGTTLSLGALAAGYAVGVSRNSRAVAAQNRNSVSLPTAPRRSSTSQPTKPATATSYLQVIVPRRARVTIDSVRIGRPEFRSDSVHPDAKPHLLIYLTIANLSDLPLQYLSWGPGGRTASLSTPSGVQLTPVPYPPGELLNHPQRTTISPHSAEHDVLVYDPLRPLPAFLSLDLPSDNIGSTGNLHLMVSDSVVTGK